MNVAYDGHYAQKTNRPKWYFLALQSLLMPPNATCLNPAFLAHFPLSKNSGAEKQ